MEISLENSHVDISGAAGQGFNCRTNRLMTQREMVVRGFLSCQVCHQEPPALLLELPYTLHVIT